MVANVLFLAIVLLTAWPSHCDAMRAVLSRCSAVAAGLPLLRDRPRRAAHAEGPARGVRQPPLRRVLPQLPRRERAPGAYDQPSRRPAPGPGGRRRQQGGIGPSLHGVGALAADFYLRTGYMPLRQIGLQPRREPLVLGEHQIRALVAYVATLRRAADPDAEARRAAASRRGCSCSPSTAPAATRSSRRAATSPARCRRRSTRGDAAPGGGGRADRPVRDAEVLAARDQRPAARLDRALRRVHEAARRSPGGWGLGFLGPVPEGLVTWFIAIPLLLGLCMLLGKRFRPREARAATRSSSALVLLVGPPRAPRPKPEETRIVPALPPNPRAELAVLGLLGLSSLVGARLHPRLRLRDRAARRDAAARARRSGSRSSSSRPLSSSWALKLVPTEEIAEEYPPHEHPGEQQVIAELVDESGTRFTPQAPVQARPARRGRDARPRAAHARGLLRAALPRRRLPRARRGGAAGGSSTRTAVRTRRRTSRRTTSTSRSRKG